jgi:voltage-gated potassium channel
VRTTADSDVTLEAMRARQQLSRPVRSFRWGERMQQSVAQRRVFPYLALMTFGLGLLAGFVVTLVDRKDFPSFGVGVWWAIVTLATVGYGDVVPHTVWGRVVGGVVIVLGVTFLAFLTATVTSYFVAAEEEQAGLREKEEYVAAQAETVESLRRIEARLSAIEAKLGD